MIKIVLKSNTMEEKRLRLNDIEAGIEAAYNWIAERIDIDVVMVSHYGHLRYIAKISSLPNHLAWAKIPPCKICQSNTFHLGCCPHKYKGVQERKYKKYRHGFRIKYRHRFKKINPSYKITAEMRKKYGSYWWQSSEKGWN